MDPSAPLNDPLLLIERQAKQLQQDIQRYLDAQSEGLLVGLSGGLQEDISSNGSRTPTPSVHSYRHDRPPPVRPIRQPPKRKIGLRGARRGLARAIQDFQRLKEEEHSILESQLQERAEALKKADSFALKRQGLEQEIGGIHGQEESQRIKQLGSEARNVQAEINELETKLLELRAKHRYLTNEVTQLENSVQSKLSSFKASLSLLDAEERRFLRRPPVHSSSLSNVESLFSAMTANRRTLSMAKEHWSSEEIEIRKRQEDVGFERDALREGLIVWEETVDAITSFEKLLRDEMRRSAIEPKAGNGSNSSGLKEILRRMEEAVERLERNHNLAEDQDWRLLVVAIGAELEAFKEGREVLQDALGASGAATEPSQMSDTGIGLADTRQVEPGPEHGIPESKLVDIEASSVSRTRAPPPSSRSDTEDDEPDPDLLISHND